MTFNQDADVLARAVKMGLQVAFGLDTHQRSELALHLYFEQVVEQSGVNKDDIRFYHPVRRSPKPRALIL
jgi:histidinol phosphatase-like PHP family hydrolase